MKHEIKDPEYERFLERFIAICALFVILTIGLCLWKISAVAALF